MKLFFILYSLFLLIFTIEAKKRSEYLKWIQDIDNVKSFKKLLRTKTNVLVMFASDEKAASKKFEIFGEAALKAKGFGALAWIDCSSKDGKKVCKKQKVKPSPVTFQHFKDGEYSSDYDRKFSVKSILAFLKDPKSDGPWEEEDSARDVIHLESEKHLNKILKKNKPTLVMFYAPWCGYCKRFKPVFAEAATELKGQVIMAGIDAENSRDAQALRETYNVTGFPKTIYFNEGKMMFDYSGGHTKNELVEWLNDPQIPKPKEPEVEWAESENDVVHLTDETFDSFIAENSKVLVFFYAPWCGHCKNLKPEWEKAATILKEEEATEKLTALDATKYKAFGDRYKVTGYPTIIYFEDGVNKYDAGSAFKRTAEGIVEYIKDPKEPPPPEKPWNEVESDVMHLEDSTFKQSMKKKKHALVMFYAPWCGHCKKAKPEYQNAASQFVDDKKVAFSAVDCTTNREVCSTYDVKGYPTFYYLSYGKNPTKYEGGREEEDFIVFMLEKLDEKNIEDIREDFWDPIPHSGLLYKLTNQTWSNFVESHEKVLITIYNEDCPNCKQVRKELAECAKSAFAEKINVQLAVIDGDKFQDSIHRLWTVDMGVPTLFWYEKGKKKFEYTKSRHSSDLFRFIKNPVKLQVKRAYPEWAMQDSADSIFHYKDRGFEEFASDQEDMMVFFYSPTCPTCYKLRKVYEEAAERLDDEKPSVAMTAINKVEALITSDKYSIRSFPHFAYFHNGKYKYQYHGKYEVDAIVEFMKRPKFIKKSASASSSNEDDDDEKSNVALLSTDTFDDFITTHDHVMVMFFTSWCGHCRHFKPSYNKAADLLKEKNSKGQLAMADGSHEKSLLKRYKVFGFPTVLYFNKGEMSAKYSGKRTADAVAKYLLNATGEEKIEEEDDIKAAKPSNVKDLTPDSITEFFNENEKSFIMFYSKTCGACKTAKNGFYAAAVNSKEDEQEEIGFGIFDAALHRNHVADYDITGYPTFWYFVGKEKKFQYHGDYTKSAFLDFLDNPREMEKIDSSQPITQWISEVSHVEHPNIKNFDAFLKKYEKIMVFFYIGVCEICLTKMKPEYTEAAELLQSKGEKTIKLAAINGGWERELMQRYDVNSFPTLLFFQNEEMKYKYHGSWKAKDLVKFMQNPQEKLAKKIKPTSWQDMDPTDYGKVTHLGNETYDNFLQENDKAIIMFHSLYYPNCKKARENFKLIADQLSDKIGFGAVDCHRKPDQGLVCYHLTVKKFPSYKFYENGELKKEFDSEKQPDLDLTAFLKRQVASSEPKEEL